MTNKAIDFSKALSRIDWSRAEAVLQSETDSLAELARAGGLDPAQHFRGAAFAGTVLAGIDIRGVNFEGADLRGTRLREAVLDQTTVLARARVDREDREALAKRGIVVKEGPPPDFDEDEVPAFLERGELPPESWWPWIESVVAYPPTIHDLRFVRSFPNLKRLVVGRLDLDNLLDLKEARFLDEFSCLDSRIFDLDGLQYLRNLTDLVLDQSVSANFSKLRALDSLEFVSLSYTNLSSLDPLFGLRKVKSIYANNTKVSSVEPLYRLSSLENLDIGNTSIFSLRPLAHLRHLTRLNIAGTRVRSLAPLLEKSSLVVTVGSKTRAIKLLETLPKDVARLYPAFYRRGHTDVVIGTDPFGRDTVTYND